MKVLLVNKYHYVRGGSETYYFGLADLLKKAGHEVIFFAMKDEKNRKCEQSNYFINNVDFNGELSFVNKFKAGVKMIYSFEAKRKIGSLLDDQKPDIVHINLFHRVHTASIVDAAKKRGIPVVFTMHDLNPICPNHTMLDHGCICEDCIHGNYLHCIKKKCFKDSRIKCAMGAIESWFNKVSGLYNKIDLFITPSEFYKQKLIESGITNRKITCLRNFLTYEAINNLAQIKKCKDSYFLYFGRLSEEKGVMTLIKAISNLENVKLEIAGTGPLEKDLHDYVKNNELFQKVHFNGFLTGEKLDEIVRNSKCVILPSEWYENGPYTIMEAMAAGKPVIVSNLGGLPEIVNHKYTGYICEPFNDISLSESIKEINDLDKHQYETMVDLAYKRSKNLFNPEIYLSRLTNEYLELIRSKTS